MARLFFDTNVLLDYAMGRNPGCEAFVGLAKLARDNGHTMHVASESLKDCHYVICSSLKAANRTPEGAVSEGAAAAAAEITWAQLDSLMGLIHVEPVGHDECLLARSYRALHNGFEDSLVLATAHLSKADYLVSGDEKLQKHAPIACLSPTDMLTLLSGSFTQGS